ncbi:MAG TPA: serine hydrolase domain-containing protein [Oscillospiraceae bacterium]|nr:serine hydrolase domain-containing protein [Oscillospiraceae bacterium]HPS35655.1 serine hydrolase domain-containing protein [Oscillospiraceae bacterium]
MNNNLLNDLVKQVETRGPKVCNLVVRQNGEIIARHDFIPEQPRLLYSVSKTFTSLGIGLAESEGLLGLDETLDVFFNCPRGFEKIKVRHLLMMSSGHGACPLESAGNMDDIEKIYFSKPLVYEPGKVFIYNNAGSYLLSKLLGKRAGCNLKQYLTPRLFEPLGISNPRWDEDQFGVSYGFTDLRLNATDLSKVGQVLLDHGIWQGKQLLPEKYLAQATTKQISTENVRNDWATADSHAGYGYQIWMNSYPGSYRMDGYRGQYVVMLPDKNAVVTYLSDEDKDMLGVLSLTWKYLIDKL